MNAIKAHYHQTLKWRWFYLSRRNIYCTGYSNKFGIVSFILIYSKLVGTLWSFVWPQCAHLPRKERKSSLANLHEFCAKFSIIIALCSSSSYDIGIGIWSRHANQMHCHSVSRCHTHSSFGWVSIFLLLHHRHDSCTPSSSFNWHMLNFQKFIC